MGTEMDEATVQELQLASFRLGDNHLAVDIMRIREIMLPQPLAGMPRPSQVLEGMINLRGTVIPVVNLRSRFGMEPRFGGAGKLMIISVAGRLVALAVDDVEEVISVPVHAIVPPPELVEGVGGEYLVGVCLVNALLYLILDIDTLFTPAERRELGRVAGDLHHGHD
ncbi:MAG: chemotaxis protein CheW [Geobacter sp.]